MSDRPRHSYTRGFQNLARLRSNTETVDKLAAELDALCVDVAGESQGALRVYTEDELKG